MGSEALVQKLALIVQRECGGNAATAAARELKRSVASGDKERARTWGSVCTLLTSGATDHQRIARQEPGLNELLQGSVTRAVMRADGTKPESVRRLLAEKARETSEGKRGRE
jgi:D-serine deaminase-like pyridoxal phosphate-dependent protein